MKLNRLTTQQIIALRSEIFHTQYLIEYIADIDFCREDQYDHNIPDDMPEEMKAITELYWQMNNAFGRLCRVEDERNADDSN